MKHDNYFFLTDDVHLRTGKTNCVLYHLSTGDMNAIDNELGRILDLTENKKSISEVSTLLGISIEDILSQLQLIIDNKMGALSPKPVHVDKYNRDPYFGIVSHRTPKINTCFVELPGICTQTCSFCGSPTLFQCGTCTKVDLLADTVGLFSALRRIAQLEPRNITFHGGDPLSNLEQLKTAVDYLRSVDYDQNISLITNGKLLNDEVVNMFHKYSISPIIPYFFGYTSEEYIRNCSTMLSEKGIVVKITLVVFEDSKIIPELDYIYRLTNAGAIFTSMIYNKHKENITSHYPKVVKTTLRTTEDVFYHTSYHHPCLSNTVAISVKGDILPCPHMKKEVLGNIRFCSDIDYIFEKRSIYDYWDLPLLMIDNCRECAFQNGCMDCRALEIMITGDIYGKRLCSLPEKTGINK